MKFLSVVLSLFLLSSFVGLDAKEKKVEESSDSESEDKNSEENEEEEKSKKKTSEEIKKGADKVSKIASSLSGLFK